MGEIIPDNYKSYYVKGHSGNLIIFANKGLGLVMGRIKRE
jgi:hypothetical protein